MKLHINMIDSEDLAIFNSASSSSSSSSSSSLSLMVLVQRSKESSMQAAETSMLMARLLKTFGCHFLELFPLVFIVILSCLPNPSHASCSQPDRDSLLSFKLAISSSSPLNWSSAVDCCFWEGIACDANDRVTRLWLPFRGLMGTISPAIQNLTALSLLNLSHNWLSGSIPDGVLSSSNQLQIIDLSYNRLSGQLPSSDSLPGAVKTVNLSGNHLTGTVRSSFLQSAWNLTAFNLSNNSFIGPIPDSICANSASVKILDFSLNGFHGLIPQGFGLCSKLEVLRAGFNNLSGSLPTDIYDVVALQEISFPGNTLTGPIDDRIINLTNLRIIKIFGNRLNGLIPQQIGKLRKLEELQLHVNNLTGTLPPSLVDCTKLKVLNLRVNYFRGELSSLDFSKLSQLSTLDLGENNFTGSLPVSLFSCKSLTAVRLANNQLQGQIPPAIVELQSLSFLSLSLNNLTNFTGAIKILTGCKNLSTMVLSRNFYNEAMPDDESIVESEGFKNLQVLGLGGCLFTGKIPTWLAKLQKLEVVDLSYNQFTGSIPGWMGTLPNLYYLDLTSNLLEGGFPKELTQLPRLASEQGSDQVDQSYLELPVFVGPDNVASLPYNKRASLPPAIYLRNNTLSGDIPVEIGQLKFIHVLDLSINSFSGNIPDQISNLTNLEKLDLSSNNLSGGIPASLKSLHFLSSFSVAYNNLQGPTPVGGQFDTFPSISFEGNPGLCGSVLHQPCSSQPVTTHPSAAPNKHPTKEIIDGFIPGFCFGSVFTFTVLSYWILSKRRIFRRKRRSAKTGVHPQA